MDSIQETSYTIVTWDYTMNKTYFDLHQSLNKNIYIWCWHLWRHTNCSDWKHKSVVSNAQCSAEFELNMRATLSESNNIQIDC